MSVQPSSFSSGTVPTAPLHRLASADERKGSVRNGCSEMRAHQAACGRSWGMRIVAQLACGALLVATAAVTLAQEIPPPKPRAESQATTRGTGAKHAPARKAHSEPSAGELAYWNSIKDGSSAAEFEAYLAKFPRGFFADLARTRADSLRGGVAATRSPAPSERAQPAAAPGDEAQARRDYNDGLYLAVGPNRMIRVEGEIERGNVHAPVEVLYGGGRIVVRFLDPGPQCGSAIVAWLYNEPMSAFSYAADIKRVKRLSEDEWSRPAALERRFEPSALARLAVAPGTLVRIAIGQDTRNGLMRTRWRSDVTLNEDDMSMKAVTNSKCTK